MLQVRKAHERGHANHGWLDTYHTFSFADYYDPAHLGFRSLRVINEDWVEPGSGFGMHGHRDMEIVTCVLEGALEHRDSMGNGAVLRPGEFQRMSAGTGIRHSEFNPSASERVHLYQVWLLPERNGLRPSYEQKAFNPEGHRGTLRLVASPDATEEALTIHADVRVYLATLAPGEAVSHRLAPLRHAWLQVLRGRVDANGVALDTSDGLAISDEAVLSVTGTSASEVMLFDLP